MPNKNETSRFTCRFLSDRYLTISHQVFVEAFSDYMMPFQLSEVQFRNHLLLNAVDLGSSVGCFLGDELIGLSLNGFGNWHGVPTVYDAGTGVVPAYRRRGISDAMFEFMLPKFKDRGIEQFLLEVITENHAAIGLYKKLGFQTTRELLLFQTVDKISGRASDRIEIKEMPAPPPELTDTQWDGQPSWQNSQEAVHRTLPIKKTLGAFIGETCVGFIVYSVGFARVSQFFVDAEHRASGIGTRLLMEMQGDELQDEMIRIINVDTAMTETVEFFKNRGFKQVLAQYEMIKHL